MSNTTAVPKLQNTAEPEKTTLAFWNGEQWTPLGKQLKLKKYYKFKFNHLYSYLIFLYSICIGTDQVNTTKFSELNASYNLSNNIFYLY